MQLFAEITHNQTPLFAQEQQRLLANLGTSPASDTFSRFQRTIAPAYACNAGPIEIAFKAGSHFVTLLYRDCGKGLPPWTAKVLTSLSERWGIGHGWDSYDARPTSLRAAVSLLNYLSTILKASTAPPLITPLTDGGVQAEWHTEAVDFEIVVPVDGHARFYCYDYETQQEQEGRLDVALTQIANIVSSL